MKPLFAINVTADKHNTVLNGSEFIARVTTLTDHPEKRERVFRVRSYTKKKLPLPLRILKWIMAIAAICIAVIVAYNTVLLGFINYYAESSLTVWCGVGAFAIWLILALFSLGGYKDTGRLSKAESHRRAAINVVDNVYAKNGVPANANELDILSFQYKIVKGEMQLVVPSTQYTDYLNISMKVFVRDGKICFADLVNTYAINLSDIKGIVRIDKVATFPYWNKEERPNDRYYAQYKINYHYGVFKVNPYYMLSIRRNDRDYGIYFPSYELPVFEKLTGIKAV